MSSASPQTMETESAAPTSAPRGRTALGQARLNRLQRAVLRRLRARGFSVAATLAIAIGVVMALLHVSVRLRVIRVGYALSQQTQLRHNLTEQNQRLRLELAARKDPATIERLAKEHLKMVPPDPGAIRLLRVPAAGPKGDGPAALAKGAVPVPAPGAKDGQRE